VTPLRAALIATALLIPSLFLGVMLDDHQLLILIELWDPADQTWGNLYGFLPDDDTTRRVLLETGALPWWSSPDIQMAFFRPLSSWTLRLDHALFGRSFLPWHLHSLLWLGALVGVWAALLRRLLPPSVAGLAALLYALDASHAMPGGWIANRNALVGLLPAVLGLWAHLRWREDGWRPGLPLSLGAFTVGLLGGETALMGMAFVAAYELVGARRRALGHLAPAAALTVAYLAAYRALGMGTAASGIYVDPLEDPGRWLLEAVVKLPIFAGADLGGFTAVLSALEPQFTGPQVVVGLVASGLAAWVTRWAWPRLDGEHRRHLRWLLLGALGALVPALATFPADRLLEAASLGTTAWVASLLVAVHDAPDAPRSVRWSAIPLALVALAVMPLSSLGSQATLLAMAGWGRQVAAEAELDEERLARAHHVVLAASTYEVGFYLPYIRWLDEGVLSPSWRVLSIAPHAHRVHRTGPRELELEVVDGQMLTGLFEEMFRGPDDPLEVGETLRSGPLEAEVLQVGPVGPQRVRFTFDQDLDHPDYVLLAWTEAGLREVEPPRLGQTLELPYHHPAKPGP